MITIQFADFKNETHARAIVELVDLLAGWPNDDGGKISPEVSEVMVDRLAKVPGAFALLALDNDKIVGLAVCFEGFSTFNARPLINIHDLVVRAEARGKGVGRKLLRAVEDEAVKRDCCRVTLEVYDTNEVAVGLYERFGFEFKTTDTPAQYFMIKKL